MKKHFPARGYIRTVLLSIATACLIEAAVNADEVQAAFAAGKGSKVVTARDSAISWLKIPQHISNGLGRFYHEVFEVKAAL